MFGQPRWVVVLDANVLVAFWAAAVARDLDAYFLVLAVVWTVRTVVFGWWHPWSPEPPRWVQTRMPSKDPDDY